MKTSLIALVGLTLILLSTAQNLSAAPRLNIDRPEFDFGYVPREARVSHLFWLKSVGDDSLKILKVKPGCGCTKAPLDKSEVAVGDSARLEIIFNTGKAKGNMAKSARITTDADSLPFRIRFTATVVDDYSTLPLAIKPNTLKFGSSINEFQDALEFELTNNSDQDIRLTLVDYPHELCEIKLPKKVKAGKTTTGKLKLLNPTDQKLLPKSFTIEINDPEKTRFTIPITVDKKEYGKK